MVHVYQADKYCCVDAEGSVIIRALLTSTQSQPHSDDRSEKGTELLAELPKIQSPFQVMHVWKSSVRYREDRGLSHFI